MPTRIDTSYYRMYIGVDLSDCAAHVCAVGTARDDGYDFGLIRIGQRITGGFDDLIDIRGVPSDIMASSVVGSVSSAIGRTPEGHNLSFIESQLMWAHYAGMYAVLLDVHLLELIEFSSILSSLCLTYPPDSSVTRIWLQCGLHDWTAWDNIRSLSQYPSKLAICLDLAGYDKTDPGTIYRWMGEPVASVRIPSGRVDESLGPILQSFLRMNSQPIVSDASQADAIKKLAASFDPLSWEQRYVAPYHDALQLPLQPLMDNMDNTVYETFETDRTKYEQYQEAIARAIRDLLDAHPDETHVRLAVVGAGRGGLIDSAIRAIHQVGKEGVMYTITGVEKNVNAARTLRYKAHDDPLWISDPQIRVSIVHGDMRCWSVPGSVDILVSELLGSLGDNEASPECIDGVISVLDPARGVSIPNRYYSSLEPVSSHKIWTATRDASKLETPLVVYFNNCFRPCAPVPLFSFSHNRTEPTTGNARSSVLSWELPVDTTVHGFAGYFHADLHGGVTMSIHPPTATEGMVSWFPAFLPLKQPLLVKAGEKLSVAVERKTAHGKMWLEWTAISPSVQGTNNSCGRVHSVGLSIS